MPQIFEKWRMVDTAKLGGARSRSKSNARLAEFERDREESNRRYDHAFKVVLSYTSALELQEFNKLVGLGEGVSVADERSWSKCSVDSPHAVHFEFSNPTASTFELENPLALMSEANEPIEQLVL